jgi:anti-sigma factor RsiW
MSCREICEDASAYLDGQLAPGRRAAIEAHLDTCCECVEEFKSLQRATGFVASRLRELEPPPDLWLRIETAITSPPREPAQVRLLQLVLGKPWRFAAAAAALTLALGAGTYSLVQYRHTQASLERYMTEYVKARDSGQPALVRTHPIPPARQEKVIRAQFTENPFAEDDIIGPIENPFQSEGH